MRRLLRWLDGWREVGTPRPDAIAACLTAVAVIGVVAVAIGWWLA